MNDNNAPHYTELPIAQLEENKGQIDGLPANPSQHTARQASQAQAKHSR
ncbi:hypothetical protein [Porphyromonas sp.]